MFLCWLYFVLCFAVHPQSPITHGRFIDPDDTLYAVQSAELLDGQSWYDLTEHRMDPPKGVNVYYSRLLELTYAATIGVLTPFVDRANAIFIMAALWPPSFLLGLLFAVRRQARLLIPKGWAELTALVIILMQGVLYDFMPGHIDHHGFGALLVSLCLGFGLSMIANPSKTRSAAAAGATLALALSVALESLPWLLTFSAFIGAWACLKPERANSALAFGGALSLVGSILLLTYRAPADLFTIDLTSFSFVYIILLYGIGLCMAVVWLLRREPDTPKKVAQAVIFAATTGTLFLCTFPDLLFGPYGAVDKEFVDFILPFIKETTPLVEIQAAMPIVVCFLPWPLLSLAVCAWQMRINRYRRRQMWLLIGMTLTVATLLALFYEERYMAYAQLFGAIPLTFLAWKLMRHASFLRTATLVGVMLIYPVGSEALFYDKPALDILLYPMLTYTPPCDVSAAAHVLENAPYNAGAPKLILNGINEGMDLLLETRHTVLSAPFHENINGNLDALRFFQATDPQTAEEIIRRRGVDFVLLCRKTESIYLYTDPQQASETAISRPLAKRLLSNDIPAWLHPIPLDKGSDILLFQVRSY